MHKYSIEYSSRPKMVVAGLVLVLSIFLFQGCKQPESTPVPAESLSIKQALEDQAVAYDDRKTMGLMQLANPDFDLILANIFSFLDQKSFYRASLVCQVWREVARMSGEARSLDLSDRKLKVNDCQMLVQAPFSSLILRNCQLGNKEALVLSACARLKMLDLTNNAIDTVGAAYLAKGNLSKLDSLDLSRNDIGFIGAKDLAAGNLSKLTSLNIFGSKLGDEGAQAIATGNLNLLTTLRIGKNNISVNGVRGIANGSLSRLEWLALEYNDLQDEAIVALATGNLTNLKYLNLSFNNLSLGDDAAEALRAGIFCNLLTLRLYSNKLNVTGVQALTTGNLSKLRSLNLGYNGLGDDAAVALAAGKLSSLVVLELARNNLGDIGANVLENGNFPALALLNLTYNSIGLEGIMILKTGKLSSRTKLILTRNRIGVGSALYPANYFSDSIYRYAHNKPSTKISSWYSNCWLKLACKKRDDFDAQDLAGSIHGLVAFKDAINFKKSKRFLRKIFKVAEDKLPTFTPHNLSSSILDVSKLCAAYDKTFLIHLDNWIKVIDSKFEEFDQKCLINTLIGLGDLGIPDSLQDFFVSVFMDKWQRMAERFLSEFNPNDFSGSLCGFAKLNLQPCKSFLEKWEQEALKKLNDFNPKPLSITLYSLARLGIEPSKEFLEEWNNVAISKLDEFDFQALSSSIYAYALLGYDLKEEFINKIKSQYFESFNLEDVDIRTARELYLALSYYGIEFPSGCKVIVNKFRQSKYNNPTVSSFQGEVIKQLNRIFPKVILKSEFWIDDICCSVDIAIEYKRLIIEVDGPYHFIRTSEGEYIKSPDDKLKDKLLTKLGWTVKRISYHEWPKDNEERLKFLKKMLEDISI